jgi:tetratricopeptide (TPR) repeat protein
MNIRLFAATAAFGLLAALPAMSAVTVIGGGMAEDCSHAAFAGKADNDSMRLCSEALETEPLDVRDKAGTYVNRGVMRLRRRADDQARADFDAAIALEPKLGEGWVNRGALSISERRYQEGMDDINHGLQLGVKEPEKAYFNRAVAYEGLDDEKAAYLDYQQALSLKPDWALPQRELLRFTVTRR